MILVDTSIWIDHLRDRSAHLVNLLAADVVVQHQLVLLELGLGNLRNRDRFIGLLQALPSLPTLSPAEAMRLVKTRHLWGRGLSAIDLHLLGSVLITPGAQLWTKDKALARAGEELKCLHRPALTQN